jgi:PTH2 family peptidyl-tRNA hydrolase
MATKQIIIIRRDLKMRRGKECAQSSHASMAFLTKRLVFEGTSCDHGIFSAALTKEEEEWMNSSFAKICLQVASEEELISIVEKARAAGLTTHLITDSGKTEFNGVPTHTAAAIGPHSEEKFVGITDHLKLY